MRYNTFLTQQGSTMQAQDVVFAPHTKLQVKALLQYIETNRPAINKRKTADYLSAVKEVSEKMRAYYAVNPPQRIVKVCPWKLTGASEMCANIAEAFSVPYWDIVYEANPYINAD
jgi:hypothetical protein